jgi:hypothetical protein
MNPAVAQSLPIISLVVAGFLLKQAGWRLLMWATR